MRPMRVRGDFMAEDHLNDEKKPSEEKKKTVPDDSDIIELSDIAIGTSPEDDIIVELTEEVIDEAMNGISGATRDKFKEGEEYLDLSRPEPEKEARSKDLKTASQEEPLIESDALTGSMDMPAEEVDDHITKELDDFFGPDEQESKEKQIQPPAVELPDEMHEDLQALPQPNLVEAVEAALKKMYGDRIDNLIADTVEKIVRDEVNRTMEILARKSKK
jgi:hypothetical protein